MKYIDLTLQVKKINKIYKWAELQPKKESVMGHVGTHMDVYEMKQIPLEYMQRRGILFDVSTIRNREITSEDIDIDYIKPGDFVLFRTGLIERFPYGSNNYFKEGVNFSWELIDELIQEGIAFIGLDAPDLRKGKEHIEADRRCEKQGVYVIENLQHLGEIDTNKPCKMLTMWFEDLEATGLKCRVIATQPRE
ncbi:polyketide cyclase [Sporanaerobium hydrogeniformans]|uniref:Polyketide cyclase n=1 Tax=Sporanaerobium hydrogeniformans TaxID=3072179 RepID=A0AC61DDZ5_9FIRM|nr:cyclase family protein [Sporanaerobium hydrogeniformans]PHV70956.1 polyketide cyclase [Sporanaerobium hydrogeniformans]